MMSGPDRSARRILAFTISSDSSGMMLSPLLALASVGSVDKSTCAVLLCDHACQALTCRTMLQLSRSRSLSIAEFARVFVKAAQQNPLWVRTAMVEVPGKRPLCHQLFALLTSQPLA